MGLQHGQNNGVETRGEVLRILPADDSRVVRTGSPTNVAPLEEVIASAVEKAVPKDDLCLAAANFPAVKDELIARLIHPRGSAISQGPTDSPTRGNTVSLGDLDVELACGTFKAYAFEFSDTGKHLIALTKGDISSEDPLLMRIHSECITSETLGGCDCDCVEQLNGALEQIAGEGRGIVFYLRQEGRGAGYSSKGRDRQLVAASQNIITTFDAYHQLGLPADKRDYANLADVAYLLNIAAPFEILTNNPDKINGLRDSGLQVAEHRPLQIPPNPFNAYYLATKSQNGHLMTQSESPVADYPWEVEAFKPHRMADRLSLTHTASYPLPVRPIDGMLILSVAETAELQEMERALDKRVIESFKALDHGKLSVAINTDVIAAEFARDPSSPVVKFFGNHSYWFNDSIYHDSQTHWDYVVLTYEENPRVEPLVRVHSESLFERFPLQEQNGKGTYLAAVQQIIEHGRGMIALYPEPGRGKGFGIEFMEKRLQQLGVASSADEATSMLGVDSDARNYDTLAYLIKHHYPDDAVTLIRSKERVTETKQALFSALDRHEVPVSSFRYIHS